MKIIRSVLAVVIGWIISMAAISAMEIANFALRMPAGEESILGAMQKLSQDPQAMKAWFESMPPDAMGMLLGGWEAGAFFGGLVCALIAGRARVFHAGIIGVTVLAGTILNALELKRTYEYTHPDWLLLAGLLLPIPVSLLAGKLVSMLFPSPPVNSP
jgi:hypothetical protein